MSLYTGRGDDGKTDLFGGGRVDKHHLRVAAYGSADEMNAALGLAAVACEGVDSRVREILALLQDRTFVLGADLATPHGGPHENKVPRILQSDVEQLESLVDEIDGANAPLKTFVLPGGCDLAARLHMARAITRRAERAIVEAAQAEDLGTAVIHWINRAGDLLFAMARASNRVRKIEDVPWTS